MYQYRLGTKKIIKKFFFHGGLAFTIPPPSPYLIGRITKKCLFCGFPRGIRNKEISFFR